MPARSLKDGTIKVADSSGTGGANVMTVDVEEGDLQFTERHPANFILDRGVLDHARKANEEPVELSFSVRFQTFLTEDAPTLYEALTQTGDASGWTSAFSSTDLYGVQIEFAIADPAGAGNNETLTFDKFAPEEISFQEGDPHNTLQVSGRALITAPSIA